jgi:hypothetical protein
VGSSGRRDVSQRCALRGRLAGVERPGGHSIVPPAMGGAQPGQGDEPKPAAPAPSDDEGDKFARLDQRRTR